MPLELLDAVGGSGCGILDRDLSQSRLSHLIHLDASPSLAAASRVPLVQGRVIKAQALAKEVESMMEKGARERVWHPSLGFHSRPFLVK